MNQPRNQPRNPSWTESRTESRTGEPGRDRPITRDDLESRLRALQGDVDDVKQSTAGAGVAVGGLLVLLLLLLAYLFGKRRGSKKYAFVEIRRV